MFQQLAVAYSYTTETTSSGAGMSGAEIAVIAFLIFGLAIFGIISMWKLFIKTGRPGWPAIVPIYNSWVLFEIAGKPGWWSLIAIAGVIPLVGFFTGIAYLVLYILAMLELAKRFGKSTAFAVVGLVIFSIVGLAILAFGDAKYQAADQVSAGNTPPTPTPPAQPPVATPQPPIAPAA